MSDQGMMAAVAAAAGLDANPAATPIDLSKISADDVARLFPAAAAGFRAEGAKAERDRLVAMDETAVKGHEALLAAHKADPTKTAGDLAVAIIAADKASRANALASLDTDEVRVKGLAPQPANGAVAATQPQKPTLTGEALWKSEFSTSADLQAEFGSEDVYMAHQRAMANGRIKVMSPKAA